MMRVKTNCLIFLLILFGITISVSGSILKSEPTGPINDFAGFLNARTNASLDLLCNSVFKKTGVAMVLATAASLEGNDVDDMANRLYEAWGIGKKGVDEGVLVLLAMKERKIRIEVGYGSEGYITDLMASQIRQNATNRYLAQNRWDEGITLIFLSLTQLIAKEKGYTMEELVPSSHRMAVSPKQVESRPFGFVRGLFFILFILFLLGTPMGRAMLPWLLLSAMSGSRRSSFGGGGFGGGGFGGFGGGMSGGGGSSGSF